MSGEPEDDWENGLNAMFHQAFGWGNDIPIESLIQQGTHGLDGFVQFVGYFVENQGMADWCINEKVEKIVEAIDAK